MKKSIISVLLISLILAVTVSTVCHKNPGLMSMSSQMVAVAEDVSASASNEHNTVFFPSEYDFDCSELLNSDYTYGTSSNFEVNFESDNSTFDFSSILSSGHTGSTSGSAPGSNSNSSSFSLSSLLNPEHKDTEPDYSGPQMNSDSASILDLSDYLSTGVGTNPSPEPHRPARPNVEPRFEEGAYCGYLSIPDVGYYNNLYYSDISKPGSLAQQISDNEDSAAFMGNNPDFGFQIGDHESQGFSAMKKSIPYETHAYIDFGNYVQEYICIAIGNGMNYGYDLVDWNGNSVTYESIPGGLAMYTCNDAFGGVTISYWEPLTPLQILWPNR